jgi:Immune inhibitor A-like, MAM domain
MRRRKAYLALAGLASLCALALAGGALAAQPARNTVNTADDTLDVTAKLNSEVLPILGEQTSAFSPLGVIAKHAAAPESRRVSPFAAQAADPVVGEQRNWLALENVLGGYYRKTYTLRGLGQHIEVWVASEQNRTVGGITSSGTDFQNGDCRNGARTQITDQQVQYLIGQFDNNILPEESQAFSVAPARDGSNALLGAPYNPAGDGDKTVVLVDNVRDTNFRDLNNTQGFSYIAGFFSSQLNALFDRNVMTIDAFDWLHRTGANPPNEPVPGDNCASAPARPFLYEGVFAHEYQHLLESYADGDESTWMNEGLSDWAQTLTGYVDPSKSITDTGFDSHTQCFLGYLAVQTPANPNPRGGGPENSLTRWTDQGDGEILCDYGAAYTMMEFLAGRYGNSFMSALHTGQANGLAGVQEALAARGITKATPFGILHDWALMVAVDGLIDSGARILGPYGEANFTTPTLHATVNWANPDAYDTPGAPSNGSDYVQLRNGAGAPVTGGQIDSLSFQGATGLPPKPVAWSVATDPPGHPGDAALFSGAGNNRDEAIVHEVAVPAGAGASLTFEAQWNEELGWDFGFVQVSTDGGATYSSVACTDTTTDTDPGALPTAKENVPGFTDYSGGWANETCSLSAYAGQTVLLAFRTYNDPATLGQSGAIPPGFWVDDIAVGGTPISDGSSLDGWQSFTQVRPVSVDNFVVRIVSVDGKKITVKQLPLTGDFSVHGSANVQKYIDKKAGFVGAIVTYDDPSESVDQYAPYRLTVNGVMQPGGGM